MKKGIWIVISICCITIPSTYCIIQTDFRLRQLERRAAILCACLVMLPALSLIVKEIIDWRKGVYPYGAKKTITSKIQK